MQLLAVYVLSTKLVTSWSDCRIMRQRMRTRTYQVVACLLTVLFVVSVASPGLMLHNCRHFGTRSTQLCSCCEAELAAARTCCAGTAESVAVSCHANAASHSVGTSCCFVSYEGPFSFDGQGVSQVVAPSADQHGVISPTALASAIDLASAADHALPACIAIRHSSDPPSYILTHSFRC